MWDALLGVGLTGWLHQLTTTTTTTPDGALAGHGAHDGQAMIATLQHRLIRVPARLVHHAGTRSSCAYHPATSCSRRFSPASAPCPHPVPPGPDLHRNHATEARLGLPGCPPTETHPNTIIPTRQKITHPLIADSGLRDCRHER
jgi:hypothetical protein